METRDTPGGTRGKSAYRLLGQFAVFFAAAFIGVGEWVKHTDALTITLKTKFAESWSFQVYADRGEGYSEKDSAYANFSSHEANAEQLFTLHLPPPPYYGLRIDPPDQKAEILLSGICLKGKYHLHEECLFGKALKSLFHPLRSIDIAESPEGIVLRQSGKDPNIETKGEEILSLCEKEKGINRVLWLGTSLLLGLVFFSLFKGRTRVKRLCTGLLVSLASLVFIALVLELGIFVLEPYLFHGFYEFDPDLGFKVRPHANGSNRFGFNAAEYPFEKPPGTYRIVVVNDSFGWAGGRDENYTTFLQKKFDKEWPTRKVEIINTGYPMTHTGEELAMLKKFAIRYHPDLVLLGFCASNDFIDGDPYRKRIVVDDLYIDVDSRDPLPTLFGRPLIPKSRLLLLLAQRSKLLMETGAQSTAAALIGGEGMFSEETFLTIAGDRMHFYSPSIQKTGVYEEKINYILTSLHEMSQFVNDHHADFAVAIYPDEFSVNDELANKVLRRPESGLKDFDNAYAQKVLAKALEKDKVAYLDLLPRFRSLPREVSYYRARDPHWNKAGNEAAAEALFPFLTDLIVKAGRGPQTK